MVVEIVIGVVAFCLVAFTVVFNILRRKKGCCGSGGKTSCSDCSKCGGCQKDSDKNS